MKIIGYQGSYIQAMRDWAISKKAPSEFVSLASIYDKVCKEKNCNELIAYAQFAKETGFLYKNGSAAGLDASFHNPCGLKKSSGGGDYDKNAHMRFDTWEDGISAQVDHLLLYAGAPDYPKICTKDPRHFSFLVGTAPDVEDLGGKWAPSASYGTEILRMVNEIKSKKSNTSSGENSVNPVPSKENILEHKPEKPTEESKKPTIMKPHYAIDDSAYIEFPLDDILEETTEYLTYTMSHGMIYYQLKRLYDVYIKNKGLTLDVSTCNDINKYIKSISVLETNTNMIYPNYMITRLEYEVQCIELNEFVNACIIITLAVKDEILTPIVFEKVLNYIIEKYHNIKLI